MANIISKDCQDNRDSPNNMYEMIYERIFEGTYEEIYEEIFEGLEGMIDEIIEDEFVFTKFIYKGEDLYYNNKREIYDENMNLIGKIKKMRQTYFSEEIREVFFYKK
jgi:hypothetical protein